MENVVTSNKGDEKTTCCIVGGGPAGIFLGYLLSRAGISVIIVEKHGDFLRDFRGDTIHPSTLELLDELGLLEEFLPLTDFRAPNLKINIDGTEFEGPDFSTLKTKCKFIGFVPQWDFLNFVSAKAKPLSGFDLRMNTRAVDVTRNDNRVTGVVCEAGDGESKSSYTIRADLVVAADGRSSTIRSKTQLPLEAIGIPIDVLWFRLDRPSSDDTETLAWLKDGHMLVTIPRKNHYQVAMVIQKGGFDAIKAENIQSLKETIGNVCPKLREVALKLSDWNEFKLLTVQINRMKRWHEPGLLFIGDAAHAMSPVGGVGINLAIQDAVAASNHLTASLKTGNLKESDLAAVQKRREKGTRRTQRMQSFIHKNVFDPNRDPTRPFSPSKPLRLVVRLLAPLIRRIAAKWIGVGFTPEHINTLEQKNESLISET